MVFKEISTNKIDRAHFALEFLRKAHKESKLNEIENMDEVLDALDISQDLEAANQKLHEFHIYE